MKGYSAEEQAAIDAWLANPKNVKKMLADKEERKKHIFDYDPNVVGARY